MKLGVLVSDEFKTSIDKLLAQDISIKISYKLATVMKVRDEELRKYNELRIILIDKYAQKKNGKIEIEDNGNAKFETEEHFQAFIKELGDLGSTEVELSRISVNDLGDSVKLSANDVLLLDGLLKE